MSRIAFARPWRARRRAMLGALVFVPVLGAAQTPPRDSIARADTGKLEGVLVRAIRAGTLAPIAEKTLERNTIANRQFGQDVPLLLLGAVPSLTAHTETGTNWGYSYLRLRGMDRPA